MSSQYYSRYVLSRTIPIVVMILAMCMGQGCGTEAPQGSALPKGDTGPQGSQGDTGPQGVVTRGAGPTRTRTPLPRVPRCVPRWVRRAGLPGSSPAA